MVTGGVSLTRRAHRLFNLTFQEYSMRFPKSILALAVFGAIGGAASAQGFFDASSDEQTPRTRAEVREETRGAVAAGRIPRGEAVPDYPSRIVWTRSRGEVGAQAAAALATGQIPRGEVTPEYAVHFVSAKSRVQVLAEAREAQRLGLIPRGDMPIQVASASQRESIRLAGLRAREARESLAAR
jgi:Domain of unknown function (DUF4148)